MDITVGIKINDDTIGYTITTDPIILKTLKELHEKDPFDFISETIIKTLNDPDNKIVEKMKLKVNEYIDGLSMDDVVREVVQSMEGKDGSN